MARFRLWAAALVLLATLTAGCGGGAGAMSPTSPLLPEAQAATANVATDGSTAAVPSPSATPTSAGNVTIVIPNGCPKGVLWLHYQGLSGTTPIYFLEGSCPDLHPGDRLVAKSSNPDVVVQQPFGTVNPNGIYSESFDYGVYNYNGNKSTATITVIDTTSGAVGSFVYIPT